MKYIVLVGDGMADYPLEELGGRTPLEIARTESMDDIARQGITGYVKTIPDGFSPGSDVANLSIFGYAPQKYYTGRAPLEAGGMGISIPDNSVAFRCNLVTLSGEGDDVVMDDFSAGHITTEESSVLIDVLNKRLGSDRIRFHTGVSYRHLMIWDNGIDSIESTPPHDISGKKIKGFLPMGDSAEFIIQLMKESQDILSSQPVNRERIRHGHKPANSIWLWGEGRAVSLPRFRDKYGIDGGVISAVNLIKGIGRLAGFRVIDVPGVTGYLDTNYGGKVEYAMKGLKDIDLIYLHVEAPDEAAHVGSLKDKIRAIEDFDSLVVRDVLERIREFGEYRILLLCDHPTPITCRTHTADRVPYAIYPAEGHDLPERFDESIVKDGSKNFDNGDELMGYFIAYP